MRDWERSFTAKEMEVLSRDDLTAQEMGAILGFSRNYTRALRSKLIKAGKLSRRKGGGQKVELPFRFDPGPGPSSMRRRLPTIVWELLGVAEGGEVLVEQKGSAIVIQRVK